MNTISYLKRFSFLFFFFDIFFSHFSSSSLLKMENDSKWFRFQQSIYIMRIFFFFKNKKKLPKISRKKFFSIQIDFPNTEHLSSSLNRINSQIMIALWKHPVKFFVFKSKKNYYLQNFFEFRNVMFFSNQSLIMMMIKQRYYHWPFFVLWQQFKQTNNLGICNVFIVVFSVVVCNPYLLFFYLSH